MKEKITIFHSKSTNRKAPISPYDDKTFVFETYETENNLQMFSIMVSHFILNIPLYKQQKPIRTFRRKADLNALYNDHVTYLILDIDKVRSEFDKQKILHYFKDFKVIIGQSKSYNGIDNFNLKGILFTENIELKFVKTAISSIHHDLCDICEIDESISRKATLNAPILKNNIFLNNEDGIRFKFIEKEAIEHINEIKQEYVGDCPEVNISDLDKIEADSMEKLCLKIFQNMGFQAIKNNSNGSITFKHPSETKSIGGYFWFGSSPYTMHHPNSTKSINIFETVKKTELAKTLMKREINYEKEFLNFNTEATSITVNERYLSVSPEIDKMIQDFLNRSNGLLSLRSPMGTGKSTIIKYIIEECHEMDMKVLIITNRISVARDFGKKYNIKIYNQDKYNIGDSLICQYDSLWRYNIKFFDIVIMDEFVSLMLHSRGSLNNSSINIAKFFGTFNKKLVIADAFLTGYENFLLSNKHENICMINNEYRDKTQLLEYTDFNYFVNSLVYHASKEKLTVSATSLSFINSLHLLLTNKGLKVVTLTAETPESTKKLIYDLFEKESHDKWDVLIYSPTLTVGVSNLNNIKYHFHYDSSMSADVISSIQMIKRTRKAEEVHMFIKEKINYLKTSYNEIRDEYMSKIGQVIEHNYLFDIDDYGEAKLSHIGKKAIKIDTFKNILEFNHRKAMLWLLNYHFADEPKKITDSFRNNILMRYQKIIKESKISQIKSTIEQFLELNNFEKTELLLDTDSDKTMKILAEIDSEISDCDSITKSHILECSILDSDFIKKCKNYKVVYFFTNKLWAEEDVKNLISTSIINCKNDDIQFYNALLNFGQNTVFEEYNRRTIEKNKPLKYILEKCGYVNDKEKGSPRVMFERKYCIDQNIKKFFSYIK